MTFCETGNHDLLLVCFFALKHPTYWVGCLYNLKNTAWKEIVYLVKSCLDDITHLTPICEYICYWEMEKMKWMNEMKLFWGYDSMK